MHHLILLAYQIQFLYDFFDFLLSSFSCSVGFSIKKSTNYDWI